MTAAANMSTRSTEPPCGNRPARLPKCATGAAKKLDFYCQARRGHATQHCAPVGCEQGKLGLMHWTDGERPTIFWEDGLTSD